MYQTDWLSRREALTPNWLALVDAGSGKRYTYQQMNQRANQLAHALLSHFRVQQGDRIAVCAMNCAEYLETLFATGKLGAILVPLNYRLVTQELEYIIKDCQPKLLIYEAQFGETVAQLQQQIDVKHYIALHGNGNLSDVSDYEDLLIDSPINDLRDIKVDFEDPFQIIYTSGTTGKPKGAILSHRMIFWNAVNTMLRDIVPSDITLTHTPFFHTGGLNVYTLPLFLLGGRVILMRSWNADQALELIEREKVTMFFAIPTQFQMMIQSPRWNKADLGSVRMVVSGGAPCPIPIMQTFREKGVLFKQGFGLTEVGPGVTAMNPEDTERKIGSIGVPNFYMQAKVVDDNGKEVAINEVGELILRAPSMCSGYWNNPEATKQAFHDGWFYTGDMVRKDEEGFLYIVDRKRDMFISGGENVYPAEIEAILYTHPQIAEVAVIGVPHEKWGEVGKAIIACKPGRSMRAEEVIEFCKGKLANYKIPQQVQFLNELPKGSTGKILKRVLREEKH